MSDSNIESIESISLTTVNDSFSKIRLNFIESVRNVLFFLLYFNPHESNLKSYGSVLELLQRNIESTYTKKKKNKINKYKSIYSREM